MSVGDIIAQLFDNATVASDIKIVCSIDHNDNLNGTLQKLFTLSTDLSTAEIPCNKKVIRENGFFRKNGK